MAAAQKGSLRLFRVAGVDVFVHWSWALIAIVELQSRNNAYHSQFWNVAEYLTLFLIVLLHEFGHALACRSVGGQANRIMLWPLGGIAYVSPPPRPGPQLWSIAAGPLVNVALIPITLLALKFIHPDYMDVTRDAREYLAAVFAINLVLLAFNMLPLYPLDGGQIVRSLLWFVLGEVRSLTVAAGVGLVGAIVALVLAVRYGEIWFVVMAVFAASRCFSGISQARTLKRIYAIPRHAGFRCAACGHAPPAGEFWFCPCGNRFDTFVCGGRCPNCGRVSAVTICPFCRDTRPMSDWRIVPAQGAWTGVSTLPSVAPDAGAPLPGP